MLHFGYDLNGADPFGGRYKSKRKKKSWEDSTPPERKGIIDQALNDQARIGVLRTPPRPARREEAGASVDMARIQNTLESAAKIVTATASLSSDNTQAIAAIRKDIASVAKAASDNTQSIAAIKEGTASVAKAASENTQAIAANRQAISDIGERTAANEHKTNAMDQQLRTHVKQSAKQIKHLESDIDDMRKCVTEMKNRKSMSNDFGLTFSLGGIKQALFPLQKENAARPRGDFKVRDVVPPDEKTACPRGNARVNSPPEKENVDPRPEKRNARPRGNAVPVLGENRELAKLMAHEAKRKCAEMKARSKKRARTE